MSRPISSKRCRTNRAPHDDDALSHAAPPMPAATPVATNLRRLKTGRSDLVNTPVQSEGNGNRRSIGSQLVGRR